MSTNIRLQPGRFIVLEGGDGCGKTTIQQLLERYLTGLGITPLLITGEPGGSSIGPGMRQLLLEKPLDPIAELLFFEAERAQHVAEMRTILSGGGLALCSRYVDSTVAYQGFGRGIDLSLIKTLNYHAAASLTPDLTLWLDVPVEVGLARVQPGEADHIEALDLDFHRRVREGYVQLYQSGGGRVRVDAEGTIEEVFGQVQKIVDEHLKYWLQLDVEEQRVRNIQQGMMNA